MMNLNDKNIKHLASTGLANYYGSVDIFKIDDDYYLTLGDHYLGDKAMNIPKEIAESLSKHFNENKLEDLERELFIDLDEYKKDE